MERIVYDDLRGFLRHGYVSDFDGCGKRAWEPEWNLEGGSGLGYDANGIQREA